MLFQANEINLGVIHLTILVIGKFIEPKLEELRIIWWEIF